eukprot:13802831-Alexandrium_andersonii.AAC.1
MAFTEDGQGLAKADHGAKRRGKWGATPGDGLQPEWHTQACRHTHARTHARARARSHARTRRASRLR